MPCDHKFFTKVVANSMIDDESRDWLAISCGCGKELSAILADADARKKWQDRIRHGEVLDLPIEIQLKLDQHRGKF